MMKSKYIDERFQNWFIFGFGKTTNTVDVADVHGDIIQNIPREVAHKLIAARDAYCAAIEEVFQEHSDYFNHLVEGATR